MLRNARFNRTNILHIDANRRTMTHRRKPDRPAVAQVEGDWGTGFEQMRLPEFVRAKANLLRQLGKISAENPAQCCMRNGKPLAVRYEVKSSQTFELLLIQKLHS